MCTVPMQDHSDLPASYAIRHVFYLWSLPDHIHHLILQRRQGHLVY